MGKFELYRLEQPMPLEPQPECLQAGVFFFVGGGF